MANEKVNKVVLGSETLIDLTGDTVSANNLLVGATAHDSRGEQIQGNVSVPTELDDLNDVNFTNLSDGQIIKYNSTADEWQNADNTLENLSDVNVSDSLRPNNGDFLQFNASNQKWIPYRFNYASDDTYGVIQLGSGFVTPTYRGDYYYNVSTSSPVEVENLSIIPEEAVAFKVIARIYYGVIAKISSITVYGLVDDNEVSDTITYTGTKSQETVKRSDLTNCSSAEITGFDIAYTVTSGTSAMFVIEGYTSETTFTKSTSVALTGVKGDNESTYRTGNVNITKANIGLGDVPNVTTDNQTPTFSQASTRANIDSGETLSTLFGKIKKFFSDLKNGAFIDVKWSSAVSVSSGATSATITDASIISTSSVEPFIDDGTGDAIAYTNVTVTTGQAVVTFNALANNASIKARITN